MTDNHQDQHAAVAILGLGQMGHAIAATLAGTGRRPTVWNRTAHRADDLASRTVVASTASEAVVAAELVVFCLRDSRQVRELLETDREAYRGRSLLNLTTGSSADARALARWAERNGANYLDGAMMAVPETVGTPTAFFLYSGSQEAFEAFRPTLDLLADSYFLGTDPGAAEAWDLALLGTGYAALTGFLHGAALLGTAGHRASELVPLAQRWLAGMAEFTTDLATEIDDGDYDRGVSSIDLNRDAVAALIGVSEAEGVDPAIHRPLRELLDRRSAAGGGAQSFSSIYEELRSRRDVA